MGSGWRRPILIVGVAIVIAGAFGLYRLLVVVTFVGAEIGPDPPVLMCAGDTHDFSVKVYDTAGNDVTARVPVAAKWSSMDAGVATVDDDGRVTAGSTPGQTQVNVTFEGTTIDKAGAMVTVGPLDAPAACAAAGSPYCGPVDAGCGQEVSCGGCDRMPAAGTCSLSGFYVATLSCDCSMHTSHNCDDPDVDCVCYDIVACGNPAGDNCGNAVPKVPPKVGTFLDFPDHAAQGAIQNNCTCQ